MESDKKTTTMAIKRFGYVVSAILLVLSNISLINEWSATPIIFIVTMYFLTGSLWAPTIIKPFYEWFGRNFIKPADSAKADKDIFSSN